MILSRRAEPDRGARDLVVYISGHGFGHAVRVIEVLRALQRRSPAVRLHLRTTVPYWFFEHAGITATTYARAQLDLGAVQRDSLTLDPEATLQAYADLMQRKAMIVAAELEALAAIGPALILADSPAWAFEIADRLGVAAIGMANFSWDWIYADYVTDYPEYGAVVDDLRAGYSRATLLLRLPFYGDLSAFPRLVDVPLVARHATRTRAEVCSVLRLPASQRLVLLSFGGIGLRLARAAVRMHDTTVIATQSAAPHGAPDGCRLISNDELGAVGLYYEDLLAACDVVITKPGYGIVSDCIANGTPIIYTPRGRFREYECLVAGIHAHLPHAFISNDDLCAGRWQTALDEVFAQPRRPASLATNGAEVAAQHLLDALLDERSALAAAPAVAP